MIRRPIAHTRSHRESTPGARSKARPEPERRSPPAVAAPVAARPAPVDPLVEHPGLRDQVQAGRLEQTCRRCGRWEAAHYYCSWCRETIDPADWYRNGLLAEREARMPTSAPDDPPVEYRRAYREGKGGWPPQWGPCPYLAPGPRGAPAKRDPDENGGSVAAARPTTHQSVSAAAVPGSQLALFADPSRAHAATPSARVLGWAQRHAPTLRETPSSV